MTCRLKLNDRSGLLEENEDAFEREPRSVVAGYVVADEDQRLVGFGPTPEAALRSVEEEDAGSPGLVVLPATADLLEETERTGPDGPTWLTFDLDGCEVACLEAEIDETSEMDWSDDDGFQ